MTDESDASTVRNVAGRHGINIPDDDLAGVIQAYAALRGAAQRVLTADTGERDIALTFDPSAS
jgi:hypothetical protein